MNGNLLFGKLQPFFGCSGVVLNRTVLRAELDVTQKRRTRNKKTTVGCTLTPSPRVQQCRFGGGSEHLFIDSAAYQRRACLSDRVSRARWPRRTTSSSSCFSLETLASVRRAFWFGSPRMRSILPSYPP